MSQKFVKTQKYFTKKLQRLIKLQLINETNFNKIIKKINFLLIIIQRHYEKISFEIVQIITHNIVLKIFWLKLYNFNVNWKKKKEFTFKRCDCVINIKFMQRRKSLTNEQQKLNETTFFATLKNDLRIKFASTNIDKKLKN